MSRLKREAAVEVAMIVVAVLVFVLLVRWQNTALQWEIVNAAQFDAQARSTPSVSVCQQYADKVEGPSAMGHSYNPGLGAQRAHVWALMYIGCRLGERQ